MSTMYNGRVVDGRVVVEGSDLPEGAEVLVFLRERGEVPVTPEEEAEIESAIEEAERGEVVDGDMVLRRLRNREYGRTPLSRNDSR